MHKIIEEICLPEAEGNGVVPGTPMQQAQRDIGVSHNTELSYDTDVGITKENFKSPNMYGMMLNGKYTRIDAKFKQI